MDELDAKILNILQHEFEICPKPYAAIAAKLGIAEELVLKRVGELKESGMIRRLGVSLNSRKLGYLTTLVAAEVEPDSFDQVAMLVSRYPEVTHNYERSDDFNLWFTLISRNEERQNGILDEIRDFEGVINVVNLPADKIFKTNVRFKIEVPQYAN